MFMQTRHEMIDNLPENFSELKQQQKKKTEDFAVYPFRHARWPKFNFIRVRAWMENYFY